MLVKSRNDFYRSSNSKYSKKEKELIAGIDKYVEKLKTAIAQLRLISTKQNKSNSYLFDEKNDDKIKLIEMKKSFTDEKQYLNGLLKEFILTNIPAAAQ
jgi:predicted phosphohydrolase